MRAIYAVALTSALLASSAAVAQDVSGRLTIVTSFSNDLTGPFQQAFEQAYPGVQVEVQNRNTNAGVQFLRETRSNNQVDIFWASAPDAFEVLKRDELLEPYQSTVEGIPEVVGSYPINDPDGYYSGFAASGYGIMWNTRYVEANGLPPAGEWEDLARPEFYDHVAMAAPSRSGTTHLTIETILQGEGWDDGWRTVKEISGNFRTITERSFGVPDGVNSGDFGYGIVIDFFGLSAQASGFPIEFVYPTVTTIVPANVGLVTNAPNQEAGKAFIDFLLSEDGQAVLLEPAIRRLPVNPASYALAPDDYPNPFEDTSLGAAVSFDVNVSGERYAVVGSLFDQIITFQLEPLKAATRAIHEAEAALEAGGNAEAEALIAEARDLIAAMPITADEAADPSITAAFSDEGGGETRQAEFEQAWATFARDNYAAAEAKAREALSML
jgi:phosphoglycerate transport regulatory protein PgtC